MLKPLATYAQCYELATLFLERTGVDSDRRREALAADFKAVAEQFIEFENKRRYARDRARKRIIIDVLRREAGR